MSSYIYAFIRRDISPEQRIVQIGHACYEAGKQFNDKHGISSLILLEAKDENDTKAISEKLMQRNIDFYSFYEPDNGMGYSSICTRPITDERDRKFFRKWDLFKHTA